MGQGEDGYFTNYPKHVFLILANEFCERFSYYGMKAFLTLYLIEALGFTDDTAMAIYHSFVVLCYFTPLFGAMIADGWLGKFRTIFYITLIYILGSITMTVTAIPFNGSYVVWAPFIGLVLIGFGTGGIKPNVSAFGGDQFSPDQTRQKTSFFSLFYMSINVGSLLSTIITPLIKEYVYCFGDNCYSLAFGIPAVLMIVSEIVFVIGYRWYTKVPPGGSILQRTFGCIGTAIGRRCNCCCAKKVKDDVSIDSISVGERKEPTTKKKKDHWLDYASPDYDDQFISDVKDVMRVIWLFLPLPVFWALFDQQGSRWTVQATQMNGDVGGFIVPPDMIQVLNPLIVVLFVPIFESLIYPCLDKIHIPHRPLQRMTAGMVLAGSAFLLAGFLQMAIDKDVPPAISAGETKYQVINPSSCTVGIRDVSTDGWTSAPDGLPGLSTSDGYITADAGERMFEIRWGDDCLIAKNASLTTYFNATFAEKTAYQLYTDEFAGVIVHTQEKLVPTPERQSTIRFYNALNSDVELSIRTEDPKKEDAPREMGVLMPQDVSGYEELSLIDYVVTVRFPVQVDFNTTVYNITQEVGTYLYSKNGPVYTVLLYYTTDARDTVSVMQIEEVGPWTISIFLQVPQYFVMTMGEILFSITGLSFAYTQAAPSMKSILTAMWLMTVAIGNVVVVIVAETGSALSQMAEFFLFSGLMYVTTVIFAIMALFYKYVERNDWGIEQKIPEKKIEDNDAFELDEHHEKHGHDNHEHDDHGHGTFDGYQKFDGSDRGSTHTPEHQYAHIDWNSDVDIKF